MYYVTSLYVKGNKEKDFKDPNLIIQLNERSKSLGLPFSVLREYKGEEIDTNQEDYHLYFWKGLIFSGGLQIARISLTQTTGYRELRLAEVTSVAHTQPDWAHSANLMSVLLPLLGESGNSKLTSYDGDESLFFPQMDYSYDPVNDIIIEQRK